MAGLSGMSKVSVVSRWLLYSARWSGSVGTNNDNSVLKNEQSSSIDATNFDTNISVKDSKINNDQTFERSR